jgi:hypothetical protein
MKEHLLYKPDQTLTPELEEHLKGCPFCAGLWREQTALDDMLRSVPQAAIPDFLGARALSKLEGKRISSGKNMLEPSWLTIAAPAMALLVAFSALIFNYEYQPHNQNMIQYTKATNATITEPGLPKTVSAGNSEIYPVWPPDENAVIPEDLTIMASLYPDFQGTVKVIVDDIDVSSKAIIDGKHIAYDPGSLKVGEHRVKVMLQRPDGSFRSASWSFYLLEERS